MSQATYCPAVLVTVLLCFSAAPVSAQQDRPELDGVWYNAYINFDDPRWRIEDVLCLICSARGYEDLQMAIADPANDDRPLTEIWEEIEARDNEYYAGILTKTAQEHVARYDPFDDPVLNCQPVGLILQSIDHPLPIEIEQYDDRVVFRYEYWNAVRTVYTDGRGHPTDLVPHLLGHSIGWYDGPTLVVESRGLESSYYRTQIVGLRNSERTTFVERYTLGADGDRIDLTTTIVDPVMLAEPIISRTTWLLYPGVELQEFECILPNPG